ncbi:FkbM family methyltransferase [Pseudorhodobacter ferrugineus]|uniref:FkbM family methyltransferase n=1 Tax=Pseudorhodobacter ferrugineus TaxID=77008 RepID=UPI0003B41326|nr:FkbM family methyltransferase [Pseudorhodobacter ferrugineus]
MRRFLSRWLRKRREPWSEVFYTAFKRWRADRMEPVRMQFSNIGPTSVVFDIGGFQGDWAADIHDRYGAHLHIFEPHPAFAKEIRSRFQGNPDITTHDFALGPAEANITLPDDGNASSSFRAATRTVTGRVEPVARFFAKTAINRIDLMKINIEGGEYDLLPALNEAGILPRIGILQVQFHLFAASDIARRDAIRSVLAKTHSCDWSYDFVWEQWSLRRPDPS